MKLHFKPSEQPRSYTVHQWQCDPLRLSATGEKLRVKHYTAVPNITRTVGVQPPELTAGQILHTDVTDYLLGGRVTMRDGRVDKVLFEGGYCQATQVSSSSDSFAFYYYNHDHLGNIREVVDASGTVQQVNNYYPFGTPYCDSPSAQSPDLQPYKYNGKELDRMHGLDTYDYGARQYDPVLCRWDRMDPLCEKYYGVSPYAYCGNNPTVRVDKDGRIWDTFVDGFFVLCDLVDAGYQYITTGSVSNTTKAALAADALSIIIPGVTGSGMYVRASEKAASETVSISRELRNADAIAEGRAFEKSELAATKASGIEGLTKQGLFLKMALEMLKEIDQQLTN